MGMNDTRQREQYDLEMARLEQMNADWEVEISRYPQEWRDYFRAHRKWSASRRYNVGTDELVPAYAEPAAPAGPAPRVRKWSWLDW